MGSRKLATTLPQNVVTHDYFNLAYVLGMFVIDIFYMTTGKAFWVLWGATALYFVLDGIWVILDPSCVKGHVAIISHHILTAIYLAIPWYHVKYAPLMAINMLVEINTWLLIAKRHYKHAGMEALFYTTWIGFRLMLYPYLVPEYIKLYVADSKEFGTYWNILLLGPILQAYLTMLNFWWTLTMLRQMAAKRRLGATANELKDV